MKKLLFLTAVLLSSVFAFSQNCVETIVAFEETFDDNVEMTTSSMTISTGDWDLQSTALSVSSPNSAHAIIPTVGNRSQLFTPIIDIDSNYSHYFLSFAHICKVHQVDFARIRYRFSVATTPQGGVAWSQYQDMSFTHTSSFYYGEATSIANGMFNHSSYSQWLPNSATAQPQNSWWKNELIDISSFVLNRGDGKHFQIIFELYHPENLPTDNQAGWFIDNVEIMGATAELAPPSITLLAPVLVNQVNAVTNTIGPYTIKAQIVDNTTNGVNVDSIRFYYTVNGGARNYVEKQSIGNNQWSWMIPEQCYGNVVRYNIESQDIFCNKSVLDTVFTPRYTYNNLNNNTVNIVDFYDQPYALITNDPTPVKVIIQNKSDNPMTSAVINWTLNGVTQPAYTWNSTTDFHPTADFCLDFKDTVTIGTYLPIRGYDTVEVCINMRNGSANLAAATSKCKQFVLFACDSIMNGTYTIGSPQADFATLDNFYESIYNCGIGGPVVAKLYPGTYSGLVFTENFPGQSDVNTVTFESFTNNAADVIIVDNNNVASTITGALTLNGVSNFIFNKLTFRGKQNGTWSRGICFTGRSCSNIRIIDCNIEVATPTSNFTQITYAGIVRPTVATDNPGDEDIYIQGNTITGGNFGIHFLGNNARQNDIPLIQSNVISSIYRGIYSTYTNIVTLDGNTITQNGTSAEFTGIHTERSNGTISFSKNRIKATHPKVGMYLSTISNTTEERVLITNNEVILQVDGANIYGIQNLTSNNVQYINNSIHLYSAGSVSGVSSCFYHSSGNSISLKNNIFSNVCTSVTNQNYPIYLTTPNQITSDYNVYYSDNGPVGFATVARNTLAEWQYALPNQDENSLIIQPNFVSPSTRLELTNYIGFECPVDQYVTTNIEGQTRVGEITYRGAYSAMVPQNNVALTDMVSPVTGACPLSSYELTVRVYNMGGNTINFAVTPATIVTTSTGGLTLNNTYNLNTGSLAPLSYVDVTILSNLQIPYNNPINFNFVINLPSDSILNNNTLQTSFSLDVIAPLYDEDFSGVPSPAWTIEQVAGAGNWTFQSGIGENPEIAPQFGTGRLFFNSKNFSNTTISRAIMPVANLAGAGVGTPIMEIWFAHDNYQVSRADGIKLYISTDDGANWTELTPQGATTSLVKRGINTYTTPDWEKYTYILSDYSNQTCVLFAIEGISKAGNNVNIDRVRLRMFPNNDCAVTSVYTVSQRPTQVQTSPKVQAIVSNEGLNTQSNIAVNLSITGANTYTETITIPSLAYNSQTLVTFNGAHLSQNGVNNVQVSVQADDYAANNSKSCILTTDNAYVAYADTSSNYINFGSLTENLKVVTRYPLNQEVIATAVKFYPTNSVEAEGKRVLAFISNRDGEIITISDTLTLTANHVNTWVTLPINNYALTNLSDAIYAGIEMVDPGYYMTAQAEAPIRDSAYYYLIQSNYVPQSIGRFMIGAVLETPITNEFAILSILSPQSDCDLENEPITIKITNNGSQDIAAGTVLHYQVNSGSVFSDTLREVFPSHQVRTFTFANRYNFTNNLIGTDVNYDLKIWVERNNADRVHFNDTIRDVIISRGKSHLPIVQSPVSVSYSTHATLTANFPSEIPAGTGIFQWFTRANDEWVGPHYVGDGPYVTSDLIFFDTTYYVSVAPGAAYHPEVGTTTSRVSNTHPFLFTNGYSRGRILYLNSEIGAYGDISQIAINVTDAATGVNGIPIKIYIKETDLTTLPTGAATWAINWEEEIEDAMLIFDEQYFFNEEGWFTIQFPVPFKYRNGNIMILTETTCGSTNCVACSGTSVYPKFQCTSAPGKVQYKAANQLPMTGSATASANRWNMRFSIADIECASEKVPVQLHVPNIPIYDVQTMELVHPIPMPGATQQCALGEEHIRVKYKNLLNVTIPAGTVLAKATFNNNTITHLIMDTFAPLEEKIVEFDQTYDFTTLQNHNAANRVINFEITSDCPNIQNVYRGNDTISGTITSTRTTKVPDSLHVTGNFTLPYTINPTNEIRAQYPSLLTATQYQFFETEDATTPFANNQQSITTDQLYDSYVCWIAARTPTSPYCYSNRMKFVIDVAVPTYDLKTNELVSPTDYECGLSNENLVVNVSNTWRAIPANQFRLVANFVDNTTATNLTQNHVIAQPFDSVTNVANFPETDVTFGSTIALGSTTQNRVYNYTIFNEPVSMDNPYRYNDTISGVLKVPANPVAPANMTLTATYSQPYTITPNAAPLNMYTFYDATGQTVLAEGTSYTTEDVYTNTTYKFSGRINDPRFKDELTLGTGNSAGAYPFVFTQGESQGIVLYKADELGGKECYIDTISIFVNNTTTQGSFRCQFYLKNTTLGTLATGNRTWASDVAGATLIFDGQPIFNQGWLKIPVAGGFHYTGGNLLLLTTHDCAGAASVAALNIVPPAFKYTNNANSVLYHGGSSTGSQRFTVTNQRINTKFSLNYTCPSPQGTITLNINAPNIDLSIEELIAPTSPQAIYSNNQTVTIRLKNFGRNAASGFTLGYIFDNNPAVEQTFSGSIASGATQNFSFTTPVDLSSVYFPKNFVVYLRHNSDNNHRNDTIRLVLSCPSPCGPVTNIGATNQDKAGIANVTFAGINNPILPNNFTPFNAASSAGYTNYTQVVAPANVVQGQTYPISITNNFTTGSGNALWKYVFIDMDRNNEFTADELVFSATNVPAPAPISPELATTLGYVTIDADAAVGVTLMRVICSQNALNVNQAPCMTFAYGEIEDYSVNILPPFDVDPGIAAILHPSGEICSDNAGKIRVNITNFGTQPIALSPANAITITANVTGVVPGTYTTTLTEGTIAPSETIEAIISNVNFGSNGVYNVEVVMDYADDMYSVNNVAHSSASVTSTQVYNLPRTIDFDGGGDALAYTEGDLFPSFWTSESVGNANFLWTIKAGNSENHPEAGPEHDHTMSNTAFESIGQYAIVSAPRTVNTTAVATLTTSCMNLHYANGYPSAITYYEHVFGQNPNSRIKMYVEVGSGDHYVAVDSVINSTQTSSAESFKRRGVVTLNVDENARIRFRVTGHTELIDAAIDDIGVNFGRPDVGVESFIYPIDMYASTDSNCVIKYDTVRPIIRVKNYGATPVRNFTVRCRGGIGSDFQTIEESWTGYLAAGETIDFTFTEGIEISRYNFYEFQARTIVDLDENPDNDVKTIAVCAVVDVPDFVAENGNILGQNMPNPASSHTMIPYYVAESGQGMFQIYTAEGQLLFEESMNFEPGSGTIEVNTANYASGTYFYSIVINGKKLTKKMIINR